MRKHWGSHNQDDGSNRPCHQTNFMSAPASIAASAVLTSLWASAVSKEKAQNFLGRFFAVDQHLWSQIIELSGSSLDHEAMHWCPSQIFLRRWWFSLCQRTLRATFPSPHPCEDFTSGTLRSLLFLGRIFWERLSCHLLPPNSSGDCVLPPQISVQPASMHSLKLQPRKNR